MIRFSSRGIMAFVFAAGLVMGTDIAAYAQAKPLTLAPYRALYDLTNLSLSKRSGIRSITGLMSVGFAGAACEGYTSNSRVVLQINRRNGRKIVSDLKSTSWEGGEGLSFRFNTKQLLNGRVSEDISGRAQLVGGNKEGAGALLKPKTSKFVIPKTAIFPTEYTLKVIEAAKAGKSFFKTLIFDGTEKDKTVSAIAFIGKRQPAGTLKPPFKLKAEARLARLDSWTVEVSYFSLDQKTGDQTPSYRASLLLYENGVVTDMRMIYDDFTLKGKLRVLEINDVPKC